MQHCHRLNKAQCKLLGRKYHRSVRSTKGYCTQKCKKESYRVQGKSNKCTEYKEEESVLDILQKVTGTKVRTAYEQDLELSEPNRAAFETV